MLCFGDEEVNSSQDMTPSASGLPLALEQRIAEEEAEKKEREKRVCLSFSFVTFADLGGRVTRKDEKNRRRAEED
jgi:hypothetical protein